ncbi:MAG: TolC family protein [Bacteroidetes bacterium]|nr:TolC family protein [Bacteroidota bacterium]
MKKIFLLFIGVFAMVNFLSAQIKINDELKDLINRSFGYFPSLKEAQNNVAAAQQRLDLAKLNNLPTVSGGASYTYVQPKITLPFPSGPNGEVTDFQFAAVHNYEAALNGSYTLLDFGRLKANIEKAKTELLYSKHNIDYNKSNLAFQVATTYYNIVFMKKAIAIQDSVIAFLNDNKNIVESKLKNGDAIRVDLLNIQAQVDVEINRKVDLENSLQKQINLLEYETGQTASHGTLFDFDLTVKQLTDALGEAQTNNPDFMIANDKIKQAQDELGVTKLTNRPYLNVGANVGVKDNYVPKVNDPRFNYNAGVSLHVPIYSGGRTKQQILLAETNVKQNELAVETLKNNYKRDINQALTDIQSNINRIKNTEGQIEQNKVAQEITASRFKNGVATNLDLTNASTNLQRAELTRLQYEYQLCLAKVQLANLSGYQYW